MIVLVARRVQRLEVVVAEPEGVTVGDGAVDERMVGIEPPDVDVEGGDDVVDVADVVGMGVGQYQRRQPVDVLLDPLDEIEAVAGVDQHRPLALDEEGAARHRPDARGEVPNGGHHPDYPARGLGPFYRRRGGV